MSDHYLLNSTDKYFYYKLILINMTIKQLKKILDKFPENTRVMARGYEDGFCDAKTPKKVTEVCLNVHPKEQ